VDVQPEYSKLAINFMNKTILTAGVVLAFFTTIVCAQTNTYRGRFIGDGSQLSGVSGANAITNNSTYDISIAAGLTIYHELFAQPTNNLTQDAARFWLQTGSTANLAVFANTNMTKLSGVNSNAQFYGDGGGLTNISGSALPTIVTNGNVVTVVTPTGVVIKSNLLSTAQYTVDASMNLATTGTVSSVGGFVGSLSGNATAATSISPGSDSNTLHSAVQPSTSPVLGVANLTGTLSLNTTGNSAAATNDSTGQLISLGVTNVSATFLNGNAGSATLSGRQISLTISNTTPTQNILNNATTNTPQANAFLAGNKIFTKFEQDDVYRAVGCQQQLGTWSSVIEWPIFMPRFSASNHVALVGNYGTPTNEVFGNWGMRANGTNLDWIPLPVNIVSNCSFSVCFRFDLKAANDGAFIGLGAVAALMDTNSWSTVLLQGANDYAGMKVDSSEGTNFFDQNPVNPNSNSMYFAQSGQWTAGTRGCPVVFTVYTVSYSTNGVISIYWNGKKGIFDKFVRSTNITEMVLAGTNLNALVVGDGGYSWHNLNTLGGSSHTNTSYCEIASVIVHGQSVEQNANIPVADFQSMVALQPQKKLVNFVGASRLWFPIEGYNYPANASTWVFTNQLVPIFEQQNPDTLVINDAYPGEILYDYPIPTSVSQSTVNYGLPFVPSAANAPSFVSCVIKTCAGDNDAAGNTNLTTLIGEFKSFFLPFVTNHIAIDLFERGPTGPNTAIQNQSMRTYFETLRQNFQFRHVYDEWPYLSIPYLASVSIDTTHVGGTNTVAGYNAVVSLAQWLGDSVTQPYNSTLYSISSLSLPSTNSQPFSNFGYVVKDTNNVSYVTSDGSGLTNLNSSFAGLSTTATNRISFSSVSSLTNTLGRDAFAAVTAGTSVILQDTNGNNIVTLGTIATLDIVVPMRVNMRLSGTGVSAILY
jgi:hypothetical protein